MSRTATTNAAQLLEVRGEWERGLIPVCYIDREMSEGRILVVLSKVNRVSKKVLYHCHRYYLLGDSWAVSTDGQDVSIDAVFSWLSDPCADSTRNLRIFTDVSKLIDGSMDQPFTVLEQE